MVFQAKHIQFQSGLFPRASVLYAACFPRQSQSWKAAPCPLPVTTYFVHSQLPSVWEDSVLHAQPEHSPRTLTRQTFRHPEGDLSDTSVVATVFKLQITYFLFLAGCFLRRLGCSLGCPWACERASRSPTCRSTGCALRLCCPSRLFCTTGCIHRRNRLSCLQCASR